MVTIKDVSKRCGYSVTTVSKALNDYSDISDATKQKILDLCDEMGYVPNLSARSLVSKKTYTIGVIFEEITGVGLQHPLFSKILESFKTRVELEGYDVMLLSRSIGTQHGSYLEHSIRKQVEGVFILCSDFQSDEIVKLCKSPIPVSVIDYSFAGVSNITSNNKRGVFQAVKHLYDLGHRKIGNIYGGTYLEIGRRRKEYFEDAMKKLNLTVQEEYMVSGEFFSKEDGYKAMNVLLELKNPPTAIFCASDMIAIGAMQAIKEAGLSVPEDFSLVGFDGIDIGQLLSPRLTTIRQDSRKMGQLSANQLLQMIGEKSHHQLNETITVDTFLISGETTRVYRDEDH
jgi:LacI family transcriptional regulator